MLYKKLTEEGFVGELGRVFRTPPQANGLLIGAGLPGDKLPVFAHTTAADYWVEVCERLALGVVENGLSRLVQAAAKEFPGNPIFRTCLRVVAASLGKDTPPAPAPKLVVLFLAANPKDTGRLRLDEELRTITESLPREASVTFVPKVAVRTTDLLKAIVETTPAILHFSGHGDTGGQIVLEDPVGRAKTVSAEALADLLKAHNQRNPYPVRCVVLNACYTAGAAQALTAAVEVVTGCTDAIGDQAAIEFARGFYTGIANHRSLGASFRLGRAQIKVESLPDAHILDLRAREGINPDEQVLL